MGVKVGAGWKSSSVIPACAGMTQLKSSPKRHIIEAD
jgi:hypothetical protein